MSSSHQDISFVFVFPASVPGARCYHQVQQRAICYNSFDKAHLKWKHKVISFSYQIKSPFIASMGSLHPQIGTFKWSRCSNKRVLYALCTFVDIIVNSLICVRAERTGEMFLCLVMEPSWDAAAGVMLCAHLVLSLSHSNVTSRSGSRDQHKVYQEKWLLEIENDIFYPAYYRVLKILSPHFSFPSLRSYNNFSHTSSFIPFGCIVREEEGTLMARKLWVWGGLCRVLIKNGECTQLWHTGTLRRLDTGRWQWWDQTRYFSVSPPPASPCHSTDIAPWSSVWYSSVIIKLFLHYANETRPPVDAPMTDVFLKSFMHFLLHHLHMLFFWI